MADKYKGRSYRRHIADEEAALALRRWRLANGLPQRKVAVMFGVARSTLACWEMKGVPFSRSADVMSVVQ